jgi:predicted TIM-barrel fold metal-dependent hydrolase
MLADDNARRLGMTRRRFLNSVMGSAAALFVLNACSRDKSKSDGTEPGGTFNVTTSSTIDRDNALGQLGGEEFIFDVQTHYVNYDQAPGLGEWTAVFPFANCQEGKDAKDPKACFTADAYFREVFVRSDTSMSLLSALPTPGTTGLSNDDMVYAIDVATRIGCTDRVLMHGGAYPHRGPIEAALAAMTEVREKHDIAAWKIYTMSPAAAAFYFDDHDDSRPQIGQRFIEHVREIGPRIICAHKGISSIVGATPELASPVDIGPAAKRNPDVSFVVYHSGYEPGRGGTGPFNPDDPNPQGVDRLIRSLQDAGVEPNANVYAELGGTWWFLMRTPTQAAHVLGKLLKYVGDKRVVWGTDSIWFGTPQDQIQAMRTFEISEALQEQYGYPALTKEIKAGIFGLNSAALYHVTPITGQCELSASDIEQIRADLPTPSTYGPETNTEAAKMLAAHQAGYLL